METKRLKYIEYERNINWNSTNWSGIIKKKLNMKKHTCFRWMVCRSLTRRSYQPPFISTKPLQNNSVDMFEALLQATPCRHHATCPSTPEAKLILLPQSGAEYCLVAFVDTLCWPISKCLHSLQVGPVPDFGVHSYQFADIERCSSSSPPNTTLPTQGTLVAWGLRTCMSCKTSFLPFRVISTSRNRRMV